MSSRRSAERSSRFRAGVILLAVGVILLAGQLTQEPLWAMLALGATFIVAYFATREYGFLVPGGILAGLGIALLLQVYGPQPDNPAMFMVPFGLGFVGIWVVDRLYTRASNWWPLVPGGIMVAIGLALWRGGAALELLEAAGTWWPVILIAVGGWFLLQLWREGGARGPAPEADTDAPEPDDRTE